jgi:hypothetical protein
LPKIYDRPNKGSIAAITRMAKFSPVGAARQSESKVHQSSAVSEAAFIAALRVFTAVRTTAELSSTTNPFRSLVSALCCASRLRRLVDDSNGNAFLQLLGEAPKQFFIAADRPWNVKVATGLYRHERDGVSGNYYADE